MKFILSIASSFIIFLASGQSSFTMCSWNIANFGKTKTDAEIKFIAKTLKKFDVFAIIEVVAGKGGPEAVERLKIELNKPSKKWNYEMSLPTSNGKQGTERYAVFWRIDKLKRISPAILEKVMSKKIDREPYLVGFQVPDGQMFTIAAFHAVPTEKDPSKEVRVLDRIPPSYPKKNIIFCGDFNLSGTEEAFDPVKAVGYETVFVDEKTSLKKECDDDDDCLASVYDNILFRTDKQVVTRSGVIKFYEDFTDFKMARKLSDHIPVFAEFELN